MFLTSNSTRALSATRFAVPRRHRAVVAVAAQSHEVTRRGALGAMLAGALVLLPNQASQAAYGDPANIFGKVTSTSGFIPYVGEGYALLLPSRWNPSAERDLPDVALRYADNTFGGANNVTVIVRKSDKRSVEDYGAPEQFLAAQSALFGATVFSAPDAAAEGAFAPGKFASASLLEQSVEKDKKGKTYYKYELLTRTADGTEGGKHVLVAAAVGSDGNLYIMRVTAGEKRWFRGQDKEAYGIFNSFTVA